jgi:phage FluMu gp28-like protein
MKAAFEDASLSIPKDSDILDDLIAVKVVKGIARVPEGNTSTDKTKQRHGDAAIAIALALYAAQMEVEIFGYHSAKKQQTRDQDKPQRQVKITGGFRRGCI